MTSPDLKKPKLPDTKSCVCLTVRKAARAVTQHYCVFMTQTGLKESQFSILAVLAQTGPLIMGALAEILVMDRTTLTRTLRPLKNHKLVDIVPGKDSRTREIHITKTGQTKLNNALPHWHAAQQSLLDQYGDQEWQSLKAQIDQLTTTSRSKPSP